MFAAVLCAAPFVAGGVEARADHYGSRQYYGGWHRYSNYYYRSYYYKPYSDYYGYKHHYVIYYPTRPQYYYYYNPYKHYYWGRCPTYTDGTQAYSLLPEEHRKGDIDEIQETAFPQPGNMPKIPDAKDNAQVDLPPDDLPPEATKGAVALPGAKK
jgi:hypothetical protein